MCIGHTFLVIKLSRFVEVSGGKYNEFSDFSANPDSEEEREDEGPLLTFWRLWNSLMIGMSN